MTRPAPVPRAPGERSLLIVTPYLPPAGGGLERYAVSIARALQRRHGWRVVFASSGSPTRSVLVQRRDGNTVYLLPTAFTWSNTPLHPAWPRQLRRIVRAERPDVVCAHAPVPGMPECAAYAARGVPLVLTYHLGTLAKGRPPFDQAAWLYENVVLERLSRRAAHIISSSGFVDSFHRARFRERSSVIPPGVDTARFSGPEGPRPPRILFVGDLGRGTAHKGLPDLLAAMAQVTAAHPEAELVVVGDGETQPELERLAAGLGLARQVRFVGHLEGPALAEAYRSARVLALPSQNDNFPLVVLEAMASRLAVVATRVGAVPDLIKDGDQGILVKPGDIRGLAAGLRRLLADAALAQRLGAAGRELVEADYTWSAQGDKTEEVLQDVLAGTAPATGPPRGR
jgi:glycosyltransferase involved in cell wall biosynthesis